MSGIRRSLHIGALACFVAAAFASPVRADGGIDPLSGIDFVRITHPGNAPWMGDGQSGDRAIGRGSVGYEYSIGRFEVTTSQWVQFFNSAYDRPAGDPNLPWLTPPTFWGAQGATPINSSNPAARRWQVPAGNEMRAVGNISWRMAAMYCNFLHNGGAAAAGEGGIIPRENFLNGAYDVSTFGPNGTGGFSDQATRSPGARYFIPSWDESIKASHFDPHRFGENQPGWWVYSNGSGTSLNDVIPGGPPGANIHVGPPGPGPDPNGPLAQANYGWDQFTFPGYGSPFTVPLGAYPDTQSPWGLLDVAGATSEWTEDIVFATTGQMFRRYEGSYWGGAPGAGLGDSIYTEMGDEFPFFAVNSFGLRIASTVPGPSPLLAMVLSSGCVALVNRRRRRSGAIA